MTVKAAHERTRGMKEGQTTVRVRRRLDRLAATLARRSRSISETGDMACSMSTSEITAAMHEDWGDKQSNHTTRRDIEKLEKAGKLEYRTGYLLLPAQNEAADD